MTLEEEDEKDWMESHPHRMPLLTMPEIEAMFDAIEALPSVMDQARALKKKVLNMSASDQRTVFHSGRFRKWATSDAVRNGIVPLGE